MRTPTPGDVTDVDGRGGRRPTRTATLAFARTRTHRPHDERAHAKKRARAENRRRSREPTALGGDVPRGVANRQRSHQGEEESRLGKVEDARDGGGNAPRRRVQVPRLDGALKYFLLFFRSRRRRRRRSVASAAWRRAGGRMVGRRGR